MVKDSTLSLPGPGSIPGQGTKSHMAWPKKKKRKISAEC